MLRDYQLEYLERLGKKPIMYADVGTGKSIMALELAKRSGAPNLLIVAPAPLIHSKQWEEEIEKFGYAEYFQDVQVVSFYFLQKYSKNSKTDYSDYYIIIDEAHKLKNSESLQGRGGYKLLNKAKYGFILPTGTPLDNWHGAINYAKITGLVKNKTEFVRRYEVVQMISMRSGKSRPEIVGYNHTEELKQWFVSVAGRLKAEDCLSLPDKNHIRVRIKASKVNYSGVRVEEKDASGDTIVHYETTKGELIDTPSKLNWHKKRHCETSKAKMDWTVETIQNIPNALVFAETTDSINELSSRLTKAGVEHGIWDGTRKHDYNKHSVMILQYQAGGTGLNLQRFSTTIFMSPCYSYTNFSQAIGRTYRSGQEKKCTFYELEAIGMIDGKIYEALDKKQDFNDKLEEE